MQAAKSSGLGLGAGEVGRDGEVGMQSVCVCVCLCVCVGVCVCTCVCFGICVLGYACFFLGGCLPPMSLNTSQLAEQEQTGLGKEITTTVLGTTLRFHKGSK